MSILEDIRAFVPGCEQEQRDREAMLRFLAVHEDAFLRTNLTAHMTASAWVLSRDRRRVVMAVSYTHLDVYKRQGCHRLHRWHGL